MPPLKTQKAYMILMKNTILPLLNSLLATPMSLKLKETSKLFTGEHSENPTLLLHDMILLQDMIPQIKSFQEEFTQRQKSQSTNIKIE